jgi:hypothetical protein
MTILEKKSARKKASILSLVKKGEYSVAYALMLTEELSDNGKLTDTDYEELAEYLESMLNEEEKAITETENIEDETEQAERETEQPEETE